MEEIVRAGKGRLLMTTGASGHEIAPEKMADFLIHLAETCNVALSARRAGVGRTSVYVLRSRDPAFAEAWQGAIDAGYQRLELGLIEAALARVGGETAEADADAGEESARVVEPMTMEQALHLLSRHRASV